MTELGEAQREKNAGRGRESVAVGARGQIAFSLQRTLPSPSIRVHSGRLMAL